MEVQIGRAAKDDSVSTVHLKGVVGSTGSINEQVVEVMSKIEESLADAGLSKHNIVRVQSVLADLKELGEFNAAYDKWMEGVEHLPAQLAWQAAALPEGARCQISVIASKITKQSVESAVRAGADHPGGFILPFSPVVRCGDTAWVSGLLDTTNASIEEQVKAVVQNIKKHLESVGMTWNHVTNMRTVLADLEDLAAYHRVYNDCLASEGVRLCPAQTVFQPAAICAGHMGARVEMMATACLLPRQPMPPGVTVPAAEGPHGYPLPCSPAVKCGNDSWRSGKQNPWCGKDTARLQARYVLGSSTDVPPRTIVEMDVLIDDLTETEGVRAEIETFLENFGEQPAVPPALTINQPAGICMGAKFEITFFCRLPSAPANPPEKRDTDQGDAEYREHFARRAKVDAEDRAQTGA